MSLVRSLLQAIAGELDEAVRRVELRRYRRLFGRVLIPVLFLGAVLVISGVVVPLLFGRRGVASAGVSIFEFRGSGAGAVLTASALAAGIGAYFRAAYLWVQEFRIRGVQAWLMTHQEPARVAVTTVVMPALLGLALAAAPAAFGLLLAAADGLRWWQLLLALTLFVGCALLGAGLGAGGFFASQGLTRSSGTAAGIVLAVGLVLGLLLRIEQVEGGWRRPLEEHAPRLGRAVILATPAPVVFGVSSPDWWDRVIRPGLGAPVSAAAYAVGYALLLLGAAAGAAAVAVQGYRRLSEDPSAVESLPSAPPEERGTEFYWQGFRNPVLTRDIRTRLRSKDTAEFIFFASVAVAAGAFVPLLMSASDLSDPLQTARAARQVFFWLAMTLVALVALIAPGLTADVITQERQQGTLELLVGTRLRPREILLGKAVGAASVMLLLISPSIPLLGLCYLFRGAAGIQVLQVCLLVVVTLGVCVTLGLGMSAVFPRTGLAKFAAYAATSFFVAFPGGPIWLAAMAAAPQADLRQSLAFQGGVAGVMAFFYLITLTILWNGACEQLEYSEY